MFATSTIGDLSYWAGVLAFIILSLGAILGPLASSLRTVKRVGRPNGANHTTGVNPEDYKDYNLWDLTLQSLVNSEKAITVSSEAKVEAAAGRRDIKKIMQHLKIEE